MKSKNLEFCQRRTSVVVSEKSAEIFNFKHFA